MLLGPLVHHACAAITLSIAHEIGHILGAQHDRGVDTNDTPFAYGHGYVNGTKWRTMMSYNESCGGCPRIPRWSNPRIMYKGEPTGTAASDNARVILQQAERVSNFSTGAEIETTMRYGSDFRAAGHAQTNRGDGPSL